MKELEKIIKIIDDKQGEDITIMDFKNNSPFIDYFIICSTRNSRHANSIIETIEDYAQTNNLSINTKNNGKDDKWMLIDINNIVVHVFVGEERIKYNLENLWKDLIIEI